MLTQLRNHTGHIYRVLCASLLFGIWGSAFAYDGDRLKQNIGQDYVNCAVFYTLAREQFRRIGDNENEALFAKNAEAAIGFGLVVFKQKEFEAKAELALQDLKTVARAESMSRLILDYGTLCKTILENPSERLRYWSEKK